MWLFLYAGAHPASGERPGFVEHARSAENALDAGMKRGLSPERPPGATANSRSPRRPRGWVKTDLPAGSALRSVAGMDKLEEIFRMQDALNQRIGVSLPPPTDDEKAKWILNYTRAMQQETAELIDSVPWKWWAKYQKFDEQNAKVEVVDLFHFLVSLAQTLGMTADDVYQAYLKKNQVNHQRQDSGYVKKDEADSRHI
jgi:dimeric dUTPase (all-alpha-NTP-PPase superfamily)